MLQNNIFTTVIQSCQLSKLPSNTEMYNALDFSDIVCVKLPPELPRDMVLTEILNMQTSKPIDFGDYVTRDENRPWIDIETKILDVTAGQHIYRLTFQKEGLKLNATCWFSYIIQDNNPEKPYIYMKRDEDSGDSGSSAE